MANWELGIRLRERRDQLSLTATAVAKKLRCTQGYVSEVERGRTKVAKARLDQMIKLYEIDAGDIDELESLRQQGNERAWWHAYSALFSEELLRFFGFEHGAETMRTFESGLIPGLLQTEDYARATIHGAGPNIRLAEVDKRLAARMKRQERLAGDDPLHLTAVMSEAALRQQVGGREVMRAQLKHLVQRAEEYADNLDIRVVPYTADAYDALGSSTFYLMTFPTGRVPSLLWTESVTSTALNDDEMRYREYDVAYAQAVGMAQSRKDSLAFIRKLAKE
ncbi:helix-turn-helix domain-containing protein [Herbihabitans rhizosphaerae]|uniref:helix-turn-helix domain-containing protein n=1 Tax=Herbihabitans rhizosphaerae TaxID=1872711 RepID=UPI001F5FA78B|nr:helix-turn-helix transcriptional regulator [Herbihabitans rhizosphaerae]